MSVVGLSPSDIVNGVRVVGKGISALKENGGSQSTSPCAISTPSSLALSDAIRLQQETKRQINEELCRSDAALGCSASSSKRRGVTKKLRWAFSGDKDFRERIARSTAGLDAITLDTIVLGARDTNDGISQITSTLSDFRTSLAQQGQDHDRESTRNILAAKELLLAQMNNNQDALLAQFISSQDALCSRISELDSHLGRWETEQTLVRQRIKNVPRVVPPKPTLSTTIGKQKDTLILNHLLALIRKGFQKVVSYTPRHLHATQKLNCRQACKNVATCTSQTQTSTELRNSACEDLVNNVSVALVSVTLCVLYRNPSTKKAFQKWTAHVSSDPVFAALLIMTAIWFVRCLTQLPQQISLLGGDSVDFEDALGVPLQVPFSTCRHFKLFSAFVEVHFEGKPGFRQVLRRKYHLTIGDSRGMVIEHTSWKDLVKPRSRISMAMLITYTTMCAKCGFLLDPQPNGALYCESCDQLYALSTKETAANEHEALTAGQTGRENHDGNQDAVGPSRAKPVVSEPLTPLNESRSGLYLSDIRCFKNMHLVLEAGRAGQGSSPDTGSNTNEITSPRPHLGQASTGSNHPSNRSIIQDVAQISGPTGSLQIIDWLRGVKVHAFGRKEAGVVTFDAIIDLSTELYAMAESVVTTCFGVEHIDRSDRPVLDVWTGHAFQSIGRIDLDFPVVSGQQPSRQSFYVVPDTIVRVRYYSMLKKEVTRRPDLVDLEPLLRAQEDIAYDVEYVLDE